MSLETKISGFFDKSKHFFLKSALGLALAVTPVSCGMEDNSENGQGECHSDYECSGAEICINNLCVYPNQDLPSDKPSATDIDMDGFKSIADGGEDCDDHDYAVYPNAPDRFDGKDNNCNGVVDELGSGKIYLIDDGLIYHLDLSTLEKHTLPCPEIKTSWKVHLSPDESKLLFMNGADNHELYFMELDSCDLKKIPLNDYNAHGWFPNSYDIVYEGGIPGADEPTSAIYSNNIDGTDEQAIVSWPGLQSIFDVSVSPNGKKIAFTADTDTGNNNIHVINIDGSGLKQLTSTEHDYVCWKDNDTIYSHGGLISFVSVNGFDATEELGDSPGFLYFNPDSTKAVFGGIGTSKSIWHVDSKTTFNMGLYLPGHLFAWRD